MVSFQYPVTKGHVCASRPRPYYDTVVSDSIQSPYTLTNLHIGIYMIFYEVLPDPSRAVLHDPLHPCRRVGEGSGGSDHSEGRLRRGGTGPADGSGPTLFGNPIRAGEILAGIQEGWNFNND